jgi:hypothetical protein
MVMPLGASWRWLFGDTETKASFYCNKEAFWELRQNCTAIISIIIAKSGRTGMRIEDRY